MKIAWCTSLSPHDAMVAGFSQYVSAALAVNAEVDIWMPDDGPVYETDLHVIRFGARELARPLDDYDAIVYNTGDGAPFHPEIHAMAQRYPGIVILHDRGDERALQRALGAVTHSARHARHLRSRWLGPIRALPTPAYRDVLAKADLAGPDAPRRNDGRIQLTTIDHLDRQAQSERVVAILAADPELAALVHYTVAGYAEDGDAYAIELAGILQSSPRVSAEMLERCDQAQLDRLMANTDVFVRLRHPVTARGSASLMRELAFGRAVLCFDDGVVSEVPRDIVARVPTGDFDAAACELRRLVIDADYRRRLGANARSVASERSETAYAQALIEFVAEVQRATPTLQLLDRVAGELAAMRADPILPIFDKIANDFGRVLAL
jgi:glycosyltransferase involved in cell wall biosynthesis